jgi:hypothetical protein
MATLARRLSKTLLFVGLFLLSVRYVHTYPVPMPESQLAVLLSISHSMGIRDPDDLYIPVMLILELLTTIAAYVLIFKFWRFFNTRHKRD